MEETTIVNDIKHLRTSFKSVVSTIKTTEDIKELIGTAIYYQNMLDKRTTPWEKSLWNEEELEHFRINPDDIDRLYHIYHYDGCCDKNGQDFEMMARMDYKGVKMYIDLSASCDYTGFECQGVGSIFVSRDANLFMKIIDNDKYDRDLIYQSLLEDGIEIDEITEHEKYSRVQWSNPPMLKFLCHISFYENLKKLECCIEALPKILQESVKEYIRLRQTQYYY